MFTKIALPLFIAAGAIARPAVMRRDASIPPLSQWQSSGLESYWTFKVRYTSLGCAEQQGSAYYNECCYPVAANATVSSDCTPSSLVCAGVNPYDPSTSLTTTTTTSSSVAVQSPVQSPTPTDDTANVQTTPTPTSSGSDEDDYDESNLPYCEDPNDDGYYTDDNDSETSSSAYTDQSYTPPAVNQQASPSPSPTSSADDSQYTPDNSSSNNNSGSTDNSNSGSNNNSSGSTVYGDAYATFFYQGGNAGACGTVHSDSDLIGAIDIAWYGNTGETSQYCGRSVTLTNQNNGKSVTITIADVCPTCDTNNSIDLSVGAFTAIANESDGEVPITWYFN